MSVDLAIPLRDALIGNAGITALLPAYMSSFPVFTRRPPPTDAAYPMIIVSQSIMATDEDGINDLRPVITRDIAVYGSNEEAAKYRTVEQIAFLVFHLFHRKPSSISVDGYKVVQIRASGPVAAPSDDLNYVGRVVPVTVHLAAPFV
jgi:hypothetical protein